MMSKLKEKIPNLKEKMPALKKKMPLLLIVLGAVFMLVPIIMELANFPLFSLLNPNVNEVELPPPPPPAFEFVRFEDIEDITVVLAEFEEFEGYHDILPGEYEEEPQQAPSGGGGGGGGGGSSPPPFVLLGSVQIPRLNVSENLLMGTVREINFGIGHLIGSPLPGERGNSVIAAHRIATNGMQPFRHLDRMQNGDLIHIDMGGVVFTYETFDMFIVHKNDVWVLHRCPYEPYLLTLVTCDPVVSATRRYDRLILRARLIRSSIEQVEQVEQIEAEQVEYDEDYETYEPDGQYEVEYREEYYELDEQDDSQEVEAPEYGVEYNDEHESES